MANKKISQLDRVTTHTSDDLVAVVNNGFTQKTTLYDLDRWFLGSSCEGQILISGNLLAGCLNSGEGSFYSILGGKHNRISGQFSHIGGGENNVISGHAYDDSYDDPNWSYIAGGRNNTLQGDQSFIGGGDSNEIYPGVKRSSILAGTANEIRKDADVATIAGGNSNIIGGGNSNAILGGGNHFISGAGCAIVGGDGNKIQAQDFNKQVYGFIGGGYSNLVSGDESDYSTIVGGYNSDIIEAKYSAILGGYENLITTGFANVVGGYKNRVTGHYSAVFGRENHMSGQYMFGFGRNLQTVPSGNGQVMFSDSFSQPTKSFAQNSMTLDFASGVHLSNGDLYVHDMMGKSAIQSNDKYLAYNVEEGIVYTVDTDLAAGGGGSGSSGTSGTSGVSGTSGTSGTSGGPGPAGPTGPAGPGVDLSSITDYSVLFDNAGSVGGVGNLKIESAGPYYGLNLDQARLKLAAESDLSVDRLSYDGSSSSEIFNIDARKSNHFTIRIDANASNSNAIDVNIGYLQQGQEFSLLLYNQHGASGDYQDLNFFIDGEAVSATNATGSKFLTKQKSSKQSVIEPLPNRISGKLCHYIKMVKMPLYTDCSAILWEQVIYGNPVGTLDDESAPNLSSITES